MDAIAKAIPPLPSVKGGDAITAPYDVIAALGNLVKPSIQEMHVVVDAIICISVS
jgi:hypothetical protein